MHTFLSAIKAPKKYFILNASWLEELQEAKNGSFGSYSWVRLS